MSSKRSWETYSITFCSKEIKILTNWIKTGQSGSVIGLAGAGKSNLLGFLCHRSDAIRRYLKDDSLKTVVVLVDLNNLPAEDPATFFRVVLRSIYETSSQLNSIDEALFETVKILYRKVEEKTDPFLIHSALREALFTFQEQHIRLVLVLDPFDKLARSAPTVIFDNLRGLRDGFKTTLTYIVGLRSELVYIRAPLEFGELFEILDTHQCWVSPLTPEDARYSISQIEEATGKSFNEQQVKHLIHLTGGYPALLRAATLWLAKVSLVPHIALWEKQLLNESSIQNRVNDIWQGLTKEEQATLVDLAIALEELNDIQHEITRQIEKKNKPTLTTLQAKYLCSRVDETWQIFSPLFAKSIAKLSKRGDTGKIWCNAQGSQFFRGETELTDLSPQDRRLLNYFLEHPHVVHTTDELLDAVWNGDEVDGISVVPQAIRQLRKRIEPDPAAPVYIVTVRKSGYRFFHNGAPRG